MPPRKDSAKAGDELVKRDVITKEELDQARDREISTGVPWYRQLIQAGKLSFGALEDSLRYEYHPKSRREQHMNLGDQLVAMHAITNDQLEAALIEQKRTGKLLGVILRDSGIVSKEVLARALSRQHSMDFMELSDAPSEAGALSAVPESSARRNQMIPVKLEGDRLTVLVADPQLREAMRDVSIILGLRIHPILTCVDDIREEIAARYQADRAEDAPEPKPEAKVKNEKSKSKETKAQPKSEKEGETAVAGKIEEKTQVLRDKLSLTDIARQASGMPVIRLVQTIIEGAAKSGATDIHLDPQEPEMRVRYRIDGILHDVLSIAPADEPAVISRVKIMADLDITETRHPQDGHISFTVGDAEYDIRVASLPTYLGERIVLRMLDQTSVLSGIRDLGLEKDDEDRLSRLIQQPYGMILVTGPTGSGKTTTLYAALNQKNVMEESIVTLEDPVEYQISGINQVQIDNDIGVTFASTLRAALRQDIDVLLVGEIRDPDTARIAIRAAMTGHLVFSTLHTNDAPEAISTLRNMGVPSYLIASALTSVIAQRLVRKICPFCKAKFKPEPELLLSVGLPTSVEYLYRGAGCEHCYNTGYKGRTGIFELIEITLPVRKLIAADEPVGKIVEASGLHTMAERCRAKMQEGIIAPEEFLRVIRT